MPLKEGSKVQDFVISVKKWNLWVEKLLVETCRIVLLPEARKGLRRHSIGITLSWPTLAKQCLSASSKHVGQFKYSPVIVSDWVRFASIKWLVCISLKNYCYDISYSIFSVFWAEKKL